MFTIPKDCKVSNYTIKANVNKYSGGFVGYCNSQTQSITCYIYDSSVEDCVIGQSGAKDYAGGAIGGIVKKTDNKILGYNIKLSNINNIENPNTRMGAWVGYMDTTDNATSIQFNGVGIYEKGFTQNVGNRANFDKVSFVFADYDGVSKAMTTTNENKATFNISADVTMPKYPYVNVNPQSKMGVREDLSNAVRILKYII